MNWIELRVQLVPTSREDGPEALGHLLRGIAAEAATSKAVASVKVEGNDGTLPLTIMGRAGR